MYIGRLSGVLCSRLWSALVEADNFQHALHFSQTDFLAPATLCPISTRGAAMSELLDDLTNPWLKIFNGEGYGLVTVGVPCRMPVS